MSRRIPCAPADKRTAGGLSFFSILLLLSATTVGCLGAPDGDRAGRTGLPSEPMALATLFEGVIDVDGQPHTFVFEVPAAANKLILEAKPLTTTEHPAGTSASAVVRLLGPDGSVQFETNQGGSTSVGGSQLRGFSKVVRAAPGTWTLETSGSSVPVQAWQVRIEGAVVPPIQFPAASTGQDRIVVAVVDTGFDPYHEVFREEGRDDVHPQWAAFEPKRLSLGLDLDADERANADGAAWLQLEPYQLYTVDGTRLTLATSDDFGTVSDRGDDHGTAVASVVAKVAPDAEILAFRVAGDHLREIPEVVAWLADIPGVDIINISWGDTVVYRDAHDEAYIDASRKALAAGKLVVVSAGNDPTFMVTSNYAGPPWVVGAGYANASASSESWNNRGPPDVVTNSSIRVAVAGSDDGYRVGTATSFAAPRVAGMLAQAAHNVLEATGERPTPQALRAALNATAWYPATEEYEPSPQQVPLLPSPALQYGWGFLGAPDDVDRLTACLLSSCANEKPPDVVATMEANQETRRAAWR